MNLSITLYTLLGVFVTGTVIVTLLLDNKFTKFHKYCAFIFPLHVFVAFVVCWISYSTAYYYDKKRNGGDK